MAWSPFGSLGENAQRASMNEYPRVCAACDQPIPIGARMVPWRAPYSHAAKASRTVRVKRWQHVACAESS